jgi:hypothetical protein
MKSLPQAVVLLIGLYFVIAAGGALHAQNQSSEPFTLTISTAQSEVKSGTPVVLRVVQTNTSDQALDVSTAYERGLNAGYDYDVRKSDGKQLTPKEHKGPLSLNMIRRLLQPNSSLQDQTNLSRGFDMTEPGTYSIRVSRHISDDPKSRSIASNTITVTVTP